MTTKSGGNHVYPVCACVYVCVRESKWVVCKAGLMLIQIWHSYINFTGPTGTLSFTSFLPAPLSVRVKGSSLGFRAASPEILPSLTLC